MDPDAVERKLAAILSADVVGYSRLMADDEEGTVRRMKQHREVIDGLIATHQGRMFGAPGDSVIAKYASVVDADRCAVEIQRRLTERNTEMTEEGRMQFRTGVNLGDVVVDGNDLLGDGVNIASRVQALAEPGVGMRVGARSEDGLIEAIEPDVSRFWIGVQWHPERMKGAHSDALFVAASTPREHR